MMLSNLLLNSCRLPFRANLNVDDACLFTLPALPDLTHALADWFQDLTNSSLFRTCLPRSKRNQRENPEMHAVFEHLAAPLVLT